MLEDKPDSLSQNKEQNKSLALVQAAIQMRVDTSGNKYIDDQYRSPRITTTTFEQGIKDASGITILESDFPDSGGKGTVLDATVKGGIPGLRKDPNALQEAVDIKVKVPIIKSPYNLDRSDALNVLSTIEEAYVLDAIRTKQQELYPGTKPFVPDSVLVQNINGKPALAMEKVDQKDKIVNHVLGRNAAILTPQQFKSACKQYFMLLDVIHSAGFTCLDKKSSDIHYVLEDDRLIVLDWNVTRPLDSYRNKESKTSEWNGDLQVGLQYFGPNHIFSKWNGWTPEAQAKLLSLREKIQEQVTTTTFDAKDIIKEIEELQFS